VLVAFGIVILAIGAALTRRVSVFEESFVDAVAALPQWAEEFFAWAYGAAAVFALWLVLAAVVVRNRRWDIARDLVVSGVLAIVAALVIVRFAEGAWPVVFPELDRAEYVARFPVVRVAVVTAVVATAGPHLVRTVRRLGWFFVALVASSGFGIGLGLPTDAIGAFGLGLAAAGAVLLVFGSPVGYPDRARVTASLEGLGLSVSGLRPASRQTWGARTLIGEDGEGQQVMARIYGSDARDAQLLAKAWRFLWYRDTGPSLTFSRIQQVEHEALVTMLAGRAGVTCPLVLMAARSEDDAVLVTDHRGVALVDVDPGSISDATLVDVWRQVALLHEALISHGALTTTAIRLDGDTPVMTGFEASSLSVEAEQLARDVAELLISLADHVGVERAVAAAQGGLPPDALEAAIPYIQLPAISLTTRRTVNHPKALVKSVQSALVGATGVEAPEPAKLRRLSLRNFIITGLVVAASYFIIHQLIGLDFASIWESIRTAEWGWVIAAAIVAQFILVPNATGMMAAVSAPIPLRPTIILQSAIQFIGLAVPSSAARIATNVAYLRTFGVPPVTAITQGALDSFSLFIVQVVVLGGAFAFGDPSFGLSGRFDINWVFILGLVAAVIAAGVITVFVVKSLRARILGALGEVVGALRDVFNDPRRAITLLASNFASQMTLAVTLWLMTRAFGASISLATALVIVVGAVLLGGASPTPGGVGVQAAMLSAGLVGAGLDQDTAFGIAVMYRMVTYFIPPIWGLFSLRWLEKNDYLLGKRSPADASA